MRSQDTVPTTPLPNSSSLDCARIIHRALRGRYKITVTLAVLTGGIGAALGWRLAGPLFRSQGMVRIASATPAVIQQTDQNQPIPMFDSFIQAQGGLVTSRAVLEAAMKDPLWNSPIVSHRRPSVADLALGLKVDVKPKSENIEIGYTDASPAVAGAAVNSTIGAYRQAFDQGNQQLEQQRLELLEDYRNKLAAQLNLAMGSAPATQPSTRPAVAQAQAPITAEKLGMISVEMRRLLDERDAARDDLERVTNFYGENHVSVERARMTYDDACEHAQKYLDDYIAFQAAGAGQQGVATNAADAANQPIAQPAPLSASMQQIQNQLADADRRIEVLKTESAMPKRLEIVSLGDFPISVPGRQVKAALGGGGAGSALVVGIMVLIGMLRRRYNYCSEMTETFTGKARFIAALPRLEDDDLLQRWEDAARCVHHLRQTLEQERNVYLVTSADAGEGRTSVVMSLALSMSNAGLRTLVIDADLLKRGPSQLLGLEEGPGFFELLEGGEFTTTRGSRNALVIMPVGQATPADGLSVSESVLTPLLAQARANFDVTLIDAGPVLSRIETIELARQVDGVLLTVARGQQKALVANAMKELELAQANVTGVIFNRVDPKDFYHSIQRRGPANEPLSSPRAIPKALADFGPLVGAVAMSLKKDVELSRVVETLFHNRQAA